MSTIDDIIAQRNAAIKIIEAQMGAALDLKNSGASGLDDKINALAQERAKIAAQAYEAGLNDAAFAEALKALKAITGELNGVAGHMITATSFVNNFNGFITVANKVIPALKGIKNPPKPANT